MQSNKILALCVLSIAFCIALICHNDVFCLGCKLKEILAMNISEKVGNVPSVSGIHDNSYFLLNGITDKSINWLLESNLSRFTSPKLLFHTLLLSVGYKDQFVSVPN